MSCGGREEQLDYVEELAEDLAHPHKACEEDEVKVHAAVDIEEGELSSGEEGEIKDASGESSSPAHHSSQLSPSHTPQADEVSESGPTPPEAVVEQESKAEKGKEEGEGKEEEEEEEKDDMSDVESPGRRKVARSRSPVRGGRGAAVCRHFLQGKCSWGRDCRFSHDERALARFPRPHPPQHEGPERFLDAYLVPPEPDFMRLPPPLGPTAALPHHLPPLPPRDGVPIFLPYSERGHGAKVSQVEEESEGWYRLRTVASNWSSEDEAQQQKSSKRKKTDQKKAHRARKESSGSSSSEEEKAGKKRKSKDQRERERKSGSEERPNRQRKRRKSSSSESSERAAHFLPPHQRPFHYPPGLPPERFFTHDPPFRPPLPLNHGTMPFGAPPLPPHGHYPEPYPGWHREPPSEGYRLLRRDHSVSPRRRRHREASSSSPESSPDQQRPSRKRVSRREKRREDSSRNRKEQLLQELSVINKVIEKKKQKKSSSRRSE